MDYHLKAGNLDNGESHPRHFALLGSGLKPTPEIIYLNKPSYDGLIPEKELDYESN